METPLGGDAGGALLSSQTVRAAIDRRWGADAGGAHRCERRSDPRPPREGTDVDRREARSLSYEEFWRDFMERNEPVVISGITDGWKAASEWVEVPRSDGNASARTALQKSPALAALEASFGDEKVCVAFCGEKHFSDQRREEVRLAEFIQEWRSIIHDRRTHSACPEEAPGDASEGAPSTSDRPSGADKSTSDRGGDGWQDRVRKILAKELRGLRGAERRGEAWEGFVEERLGRLPYCKDWHFARQFKGCGAYSLPVYFSEDWLNRYYDENPALGDDYRFCYMGPAGTWTPLHRDVMRSFSWSANIAGRKLWILFPEEHDALLRDARGDLTWDATSSSAAPPQFPEIAKAEPLVVIQHPGEAIFVPSKWCHQVVNLDDCVSINHNWINSCNLHHAVDQLLADHFEVQESISNLADTEDFPQTCEGLLGAHAGITLASFLAFLTSNLASETHRLDGEASRFRLLELADAIRRVEQLPHALLLSTAGVLPPSSLPEAEAALARLDDDLSRLTT